MTLLTEQTISSNPSACRITAEWKYTSPLIACRFDPRGRFLFTAAQDQKVQRWELDSGQSTVLEGHSSWVKALAFAGGGDCLITGGYDGHLMWWAVEESTPQPQRDLAAHAGWIRSLDTSADGKWLASGGNDHAVRIWNAADGQLVHTFQEHQRHVYSVHFDPDGQHLYSGDLQGVILEWDLTSGQKVRSFDAKELYTPNPGQGAEYGGVRSLARTPDQPRLAAAGLHKASNPFGAVQEPLVLVFDVASAEKVQTHTGKEDPKAICWRIVAHPDGYLLGACGGSAGGMLLFWRGDAETEFFRFSLPNTVFDMDLHPDGLQVATAHYDQHVRITRMAEAVER